MKNFTVVLALCLLWSCNTGNYSQKEDIPAGEAELSHQHHGEASAGPSLNGNMKWKADTPTRENVKKLQAIGDALGKTNHPTLADYQQAATGLVTGLDQMIKECRMKGADHDALHKWLEPLLQQVQELKSATGLNEAGHATDKIQQQLSLYNKYFE